MKKALQVLHSDFGQQYSPSKVQQMLAFPITWWSGLKGFLCPFLLPMLVLSILLIPLDDLSQGFQGRNLNTVPMASCITGLLALDLDARLMQMIPATHLDKRKRFCCALTLTVVGISCLIFFWTTIAFPFPFGT